MGLFGHRGLGPPNKRIGGGTIGARAIQRAVMTKQPVNYRDRGLERETPEHRAISAAKRKLKRERRLFAKQVKQALKDAKLRARREELRAIRAARGPIEVRRGW